MISGQITDDRQPQIDLVLVDGNDIQQTVRFLVDTGYDGYLVMPSNTIRRLALAPTGCARDVAVAGGERLEWLIYRASVLWNGQVRNVEVLESDTPPLLGMAMLYDPDAGHADRLTIDAAQLTVLIEHNTPPSFTED